MELLAFALAPGIAIMWFIYLKDRYDREPLLALVKSFFLGMLATIPAIILQLTGNYFLKQILPVSGWNYYFFFSFFVVALSEEFCKFAMVRMYAYPRPFFNEPFDGIIYGVMVAMGFATLENIGYVMQNGIGTAFARMFLSVPAHATFGVFMGYYIGLARFTHNRNSNFLILRGLLLAILFHGLFDLFLFAQADGEITKHISSGVLFGSAVFSYLVAVRLAWQAIKMHQAISKNNYHSTENQV
ncbi:PrsW family intramembrane metalloprotease [Flavihumibacter profundi]|jgi:protease PrsW|uniref:PrsW family intramembrane metalloprotease n=1 Tax=Flavihumibacter profundi TaxID=2716883 RepID=UPI001CC5E4D6|nr:PrsW family glutamic-type intramembrane protease [Flavihumibacter profundi]MBZ5856359.1 PrsW family intramembrane metalloprotease [Flavihumibacter profundi]